MALTSTPNFTSNQIVSFSVKKLGISNIKGTHSVSRELLMFNENDLKKSVFEVRVNPASIETGKVKRDQYLKNKDFFDVEKYPEINFQSTSFEKNENNFEVVRKLNLLKQTKEIKIPITFKNQSNQSKFSIQRLDYALGIKFPSFILRTTVGIAIHLRNR